MDPEVSEIVDKISDLFFNLEAKKQLQIIEVVTASMCCRMADKKLALVVADGFNKHIKQLIESYFEDYASN